MAMAHFVHSLDDDVDEIDGGNDDGDDDDDYGDCTKVRVVHWTLWCVSNPIFFRQVVLAFASFCQILQKGKFLG